MPSGRLLFLLVLTGLGTRPRRAWSAKVTTDGLIQLQCFDTSYCHPGT